MDKLRELVKRAEGWKPSDLRKYPTATLELIDSLRIALEAALRQQTPAVGEPGEISDGYHTFNELYEHRHALFSVICATFNGWKSMLHEDGTMFEGWFIAGVMTPKGMATYHLPMDWWGRFKATIVRRAPKWDGHTAQQVPERIASLAGQPATPPTPREGLNASEIMALLNWRFGVSSVTGEADVAWLTEQLNKLVAHKASGRAAGQTSGDALREALKAYMFCEQTDGGRNPHKPGTNRHRAFELGRAALGQTKGTQDLINRIQRLDVKGTVHGPGFTYVEVPVMMRDEIVRKLK